MVSSVAKTETVDIKPETSKQGLFSFINEDINCVFERDPAARRKFEVLTTYPGVHAIILHRIANRLWLKGWHFFARIISFMSRVITNIDIHPGATIGHRFFIDHGAGVVVSKYRQNPVPVKFYRQQEAYWLLDHIYPDHKTLLPEVRLHVRMAVAQVF